MGVRLARQLFLVGLALALWSALGRPYWLELVGCYLAALGLIDFAGRFSVLPSLPVRAWAALGLLLALPGLRFGYNARERFVEQAGLVGVTERLRDRWRLAQSPMIAPQLLSTAEPQSFFVRAESEAVRVQLGESLRLEGLALGGGLFRLDYDPHRDGVPKQLEGELAIRIETDSGSATRSMKVVTPLAHPRWFCRSPSGQRAATPSEETDELIVIGIEDQGPARIPVGDGPVDCAFVDQQHVAVSHRHAPELWLIDLSASPVSTRKLGLSEASASAPHDAAGAVSTRKLGLSEASASAPHDAAGAVSTRKLGLSEASASAPHDAAGAVSTRKLGLSEASASAPHDAAGASPGRTPNRESSEISADVHGVFSSECLAENGGAPMRGVDARAADFDHPEQLPQQVGQPATRVFGPLAGTLGRLVWDAERGELLVVGDSRSGSGLWRVAWPELRALGFCPLPSPADWLAWSDDALIVSSRADASLQRWQREGACFAGRERIALSRPAAALTVAPGRVVVAVTDYRPAHSPPQLGNHFVQDQLLVLSSRTLELERRVLTARRSERQTKPGDVDQGGSPLGLWPLSDGRLAIAFAGSDELWRLGLPEGEPESTRLVDDDFYTPHGVVELSNGTLWLASPARGALAKLPVGSSKLRLVPLTPSDQVLQRSRSEALARRIGERGFYESTRSGISCQSCHTHADSDFASYNLGDHRLIPTLSVRGLAGTAPYLRDGSYPRIADLDHVAQELYRGYVRQQPGRRYALQAYVESLPRVAPGPADDVEAERRGYAVFRRAGCERCHTPPAFTNLGQLPLAALFPRTAAGLERSEQLDVPALLSVAATPPYLHDGRARTLHAVITDENPDDLHGKTRDLSDAERADLLRFVESL